MELDKICSKAIEAVKATGKFISAEKAKNSNLETEEKGVHDLVTRVDKSAEEMLVAQLKEVLPEAGFLTEEGTIATSNNDLRWIIDPIDGTTNFIDGIPCYSVSVALARKQELLLGIVYEITKDECFYAHKESKAFLNHIPIQCSDSLNLDQSLIATGFPYRDFDLLDDYLQLFKAFLQKSRGLRRIGSAAVDLAYVACGRFDAFYEYNLNPWDICGGALIVQQAGGRVTDFNGTQNYFNGASIVASNINIKDEMLQTIARNFNLSKLNAL